MLIRRAGVRPSSCVLSIKVWKARVPGCGNFPVVLRPYLTPKNPTVTYATPGVYDVSLTVTNNAGSDKITFSQYIEVGEYPLSNFRETARERLVIFDNLSIAGESYEWDFGDNSGSMEENPVHDYLEDGIYTVCLRVFNGCGDDEYCTDIEIISKPFVEFTVDTTCGCIPFDVNFANLSSDNVTTWEWEFVGGDPSTSSEKEPTVTYDSAGVFDVTLIARNKKYETKNQKKAYIKAMTKPSADFDFDIMNKTVEFENLTIDTSKMISWSFGDGETSTERDPTHTYAKDGIYKVQLIVSNPCGPDTVEKVVKLSNLPFADFYGRSP